VRLDLRATLGAGLVAGAVFLALEMVLWPLLGLGTAWVPLRMIAAILLGPEVLPPPSGFHAGVLVAALLVHFSLSTVYASVFSAMRYLLLHGWNQPGLAELPHGMYGLVIYLINFYLFTGLFPWFVEARHEISVLVHLVWGLMLPWTYDTLSAHGRRSRRRARAPARASPLPDPAPGRSAEAARTAGRQGCP
jgi:hypothetical protein